MKRQHLPAALLAALMLLAAACGQKSGVALSAGGTGATGGDSTGLEGGGETVPTETGEAPVEGEAEGATASGPTQGATGASGGAKTPGGATAPGAQPGAPTGGGAAATTSGKQDRTGINDAKKQILIGIHAPVTGAAPIEQKTFDFGKEVYWKFVEKNGGILGGYNVKVTFRDDQFSPTVARAKCQEMVENDKVFLLVGGAGADQITSCARYAESVGVPYVSAGVNTEGLNTLRNYFALSMTYAQQAPLLAQLAKNKLGKTKYGLAVLDTPDFVDARKAAITAFEAQGITKVADEKIPKTAGKSDTDAVAANLAKAGADIVYVLTSPTIFLNLVKSIKQQVGYDPDMIGPGITNGLNLVAQVGCPDAAKAQFLSPFPQLDVINDLDPDYMKAYQEFVTNSNPNQRPDDIGIALWGLAKTLRQVLEASAADGKSLSRQSFIAGITSGKEFKTNVFPPVTFSASKHFGSSQAHLLQAECAPPGPRFKTAAQFAAGF